MDEIVEGKVPRLAGMDVRRPTHELSRLFYFASIGLMVFFLLYAACVQRTFEGAGEVSEISGKTDFPTFQDIATTK